MDSNHPRFKILAAFAAVYIIWGSTYLAIRLAVESIPPFFMAGSRFVLAGGGLYAWLSIRGAAKPTLSQWKSTTVVGAMLLLIGNGGVSWAEQFVPSGITALLIAITPLWFVVFDWWNRGVKPTASTIGGLILGTIGIIVLIDPVELVGGDQVNLLGAFVLLVATISWAWGSLYSRHAEMPSSPLLATAMEMLSGGILLMIFSAVSGEMFRLDPAAMTTPSILSLFYLVVFGSLVAFTSYIWLLKTVHPALVSTYAYVNPVIAVFLGWLIAGEPLGGRILLAAAIIVAAVALITTMNARKRGE
ncbi:MAG TPA: drug/metabolite exporter YedA [Bacteroidota bacterium]|nr:drug/metabolite exporter YedA [Bacteroidota bacterium]